MLSIRLVLYDWGLCGNEREFYVCEILKSVTKAKSFRVTYVREWIVVCGRCT